MPVFPGFPVPDDYEFDNYCYDFTVPGSITKKTYVDLPLCTACWRDAHDGEWPCSLKLDAPTEKCHQCGHLTESGLFTRKPADE